MSSYVLQKMISGVVSESIPSFVFLGGTMDSVWRDTLINKLTCSFFNPVVDNWSEEDVLREEQMKSNAAVSAYVITPKQKGFYSFVEMTAEITSGTKQVYVYFMDNDDGFTFTDAQLKSNEAIVNLLSKYPCVSFVNDMDKLAMFLNNLLVVRE